MRHQGWVSCIADHNLWMKAKVRLSDGHKYYAYALLYVDDILITHHGSLLSPRDRPIFQDETTSGKGNLQMIKKTPHFLLNFLKISTIFASFSRAHAGTLQNPSICPCATTLQKNSVEASCIFYGNLMLCINWFY
jgi:hypothetical protein